MTAQEKITELQEKILKSNNLITEYKNSNEAVDGWINYAKGLCGAQNVLDPNISTAAFYPVSCSDAVSHIRYNLGRIKTEQNNIIGWKSQIDTLSKDPTIIIAINEAAAAAQRKTIWTYAIVAVIIIGVLIFVWWKWIRK